MRQIPCVKRAPWAEAHMAEFDAIRISQSTDEE